MNLQDMEDIFKAIQGLYMVLDRNLTIVAVTDDYLRAVAQDRNATIGRNVFDVFPDNPDDSAASAVKNFTASFNRVFALKKSDTMPIQRRDVRLHGNSVSADGSFQERYWRPFNSPILGPDGEVRWIMHRVEDVTEAIRARHQPALSPRQREMQETIGKLRQANWLLAGLSDAMAEVIVRHLTLVRLTTDMVLIEAFEPIDTICFPLSGLVSMSRHLSDGSSAEVTVGSVVGMIGVSALLDQRRVVTDAKVLVAGVALRMQVHLLHEIMALHPNLRRELANQVLPPLMAQLSQMVVCNTRHTLGQRIARWLLTAHASLGKARIDVGQEVIASLLGVRRAGVTQALGHLAELGIVSTARGSVEIHDVPRLEEQACECYRDIAQTLRIVYRIPPNPNPDDPELRALQGRYFELERQMRASAREA